MSPARSQRRPTCATGKRGVRAAETPHLSLECMEILLVRLRPRTGQSQGWVPAIGFQWVNIAAACDLHRSPAACWNSSDEAAISALLKGFIIPPPDLTATGPAVPYLYTPKTAKSDLTSLFGDNSSRDTYSKYSRDTRIAEMLHGDTSRGCSLCLHYVTFRFASCITLSRTCFQ